MKDGFSSSFFGFSSRSMFSFDMGRVSDGVDISCNGFFLKLGIGFLTIFDLFEDANADNLEEDMEERGGSAVVVCSGFVFNLSNIDIDEVLLVSLSFFDSKAFFSALAFAKAAILDIPLPLTY